MLSIALAFCAFFAFYFTAPRRNWRGSSKGDAAVAEKPAAAPPAPKPPRLRRPSRRQPRDDALNLLAARRPRGPLGRLHQRADQRVTAMPRSALRSAISTATAARSSMRIFALKPIGTAAEGSEIIGARGLRPGDPAHRQCHRQAASGRQTVPSWLGGRAANCLNGPAVRKPSASWLPRKLKSNSRRGHWEGEAPAEPRSLESNPG